MIASRRARSWLVWSLGGCLLAGCKDPPGDEATSSSPGEGSPTKTDPSAPVVATPTWPDDPMPELRTGTRTLKALDAIEGRIVARRVAGAEYLELELPRPSSGVAPGLHVHVEGLDSAVAVLDETDRGGPIRMLVRVAKANTVAPAEIRGTLYFTVFDGGAQAAAAPFVAKGPLTRADDGELEARFFTVMSTSLFDDSSWWLTRQARHPWHSFASARVHPATRGIKSAGAVAPRPVRPTTDFAQLMYTTTAATSIQEALQYDRGMRIATADDPQTIPVAELAAPALVEHPFDRMLAALPEPKAGEPEPLAAATPAEFWYVRFDDIRVFLRVLDEADTWITPVTHVFEERAEVHDLSSRYQRQLGLRRTGLAKALGHTVIDRMAVVGSDPYFREGSDVTFVFDVAAQSVFDNELAGHLEAYRAEVPGIATTSITHGAYTITVNRDPEGLVRQHRAQAGDLAIVSNSEAACKAVLDAIDGKRAKLSDQKDLAYMLARDPGRHAGFVFLGDAFIAAVVGPAQKVQESRRQRALAELLTPGYAALLYGWLEGKAPADTDTLVASKLLDASELQHGDGTAIAFTPGQPARSTWGRPGDLTPLVDLPPVTKVTAQEKDAYATFTRGYQEYWRNFIDPVAVRLDLEEHDGVERAIVDIRVL
ncbi:MAG TPA: hypothetical protein VFG69_16045, partial [Nannocystaceae bacterium]|nr:hypothetical protein [Nannocystaceae bacterium]